MYLLRMRQGPGPTLRPQARPQRPLQLCPSCGPLGRRKRQLLLLQMLRRQWLQSCYHLQALFVCSLRRLINPMPPLRLLRLPPRQFRPAALWISCALCPACSMTRCASVGRPMNGNTRRSTAFAALVAFLKPKSVSVSGPGCRKLGRCS